jgi:hypothetical protein
LATLKNRFLDQRWIIDFMLLVFYCVFVFILPS